MHKFTKTISFTLAISLLLSSNAFAGTWISDSGVWSYKNDDGTKSIGWQQIDGEYYYFDENGVMAHDTTVDGYTINSDGVWVQDADTNATQSTNSEYPLEGMLDVLGICLVDVTTAEGTETTQVYHNNINHLGSYEKTMAAEDALINKCVAEDTTKYFYEASADELYILCKLANRPYNYMPNYSAFKAEKIPELDIVTNEVRKFLNSFDWKNASDVEKARMIAKEVDGTYYTGQTLEEKYENDKHLLYNCLILHRTDCIGFKDGFKFLARCVGLDFMTGGSIVLGHTYPIFRIDKAWYTYEPGSKLNQYSTFSPYDIIKQDDAECEIFNQYMPITSSTVRTSMYRWAQRNSNNIKIVTNPIKIIE